MSIGRAAMALVAMGVFVAAASPARAQIPVGAQTSEPPTNAPVHAGPLTLSPAISLTNFGHDNNVFNRNSDDNPKGDMTATVSPAVDGWLRLPHARMNGHSQLDFYYFKELTDLRTIDNDSRAHVDVLLNRLTPYFEGTLANTHHRQNLEIDAIAGRRNEDLRAGAYVRLTAKVSAGAYASRSRLDYEANSFYLDTDLARALNYTASGGGAAIRWALTPYTTVAVEMNRERQRFDFAAERDGSSVQVGPSVEFNPQALVSGRASFGFLRHRFLTAGLPDYQGSAAYADLAYIFREGTRFSLAARRRLEYSYVVELRDYVDQEITGFVTQRLGQSWDAGGSFGRGRIAYRQETAADLETPAADETVLTSSVDVGYNIGRTRVGFHVERRSRQADRGRLDRGYNRLRIGSSLTYAFQ